MLLSEDYLPFVKCFEDENPYMSIMATDYHWSHVASVRNRVPDDFETTSD